ncbi:unnamed protein product, partial [Callosobruchus maculatus]
QFVNCGNTVHLHAVDLRVFDAILRRLHEHRARTNGHGSLAGVAAWSSGIEEPCYVFCLFLR